MKAYGNDPASSSPCREPGNKGHQWSFLTNHFHVMVCLSRDPYARIRDLSEEVGITQRAIQRILAELVEDGLVTVRKEGRRNHYTIDRHKRLRHPLESQHTIGELLELLS